MALTLRALVANRALGLTVLAGAGGIDREITWVHPTELPDPSEFLDGGELLLTTGLAFEHGRAADYVRGLVGARASGLGFGIGLSHDAVPPSLIEAAEAAGLPLLEVPVPTPFIAITKAVSAALAAEQYESLVRTGRAQQELTRTALRRSGPGALVRKLAQLVDAWVLLLDGTGAVREAAPASARSFAEPLRSELPRGGSRLATVAGQEVVVQPLGTRTRGYLAVGAATRLDAAAQHVVTTATALLSLAQERDRARGDTVRGLRSGLFDLLLDGRTDLALRTLRTVFGAAPALPCPVVVLVGSARARAFAVDVLESEHERTFFAEHGDVLVVLGEDPAVLTLPERVSGLHAGLSSSSVDVETAYEQARQAAEAARAADKPMVRFAEHAGSGVLGLVEPHAARAFAEELLAPLRQHDRTGRGELLASLRCWLEHNGHWDAAAARLGVHRHTLRNRITRVAELTGRDLDSPGVRAELWLALQV
ncbi:PucR family transcriptional regulator [Prauserella cavernicola]|uniref:PucR family transcriptional regulator n=1 Tax=Prauserella cavernicola TaxID=2800127 RepID=A0A934V9N1_9PSEU|nr:PucR family transcriptional regulator [Prauserella cavernicola]MBK1789013.1 PucR family transcriptional regulator [Prauserella cavernicola]